MQPLLAADDTIAKYSAVSHRFAAAGDAALWSDRSGQPAPAGQVVWSGGHYRLYRR